MTYQEAVLYDLRARRFVLEEKLIKNISFNEISELMEEINAMDIRIDNLEMRLGIEPIRSETNKITA